MRYVALASDYDGTLAEAGHVAEHTLSALRCWIESGRKLFLVTGRMLPDLQSVFPQFNLCDCIVAENGAVLFRPATGDKTVLASSPPQSFVGALLRKGVEFAVGDVILATARVHEGEVRAAISDLDLSLEVIPNKDSLMVLPTGIDKVSGLRLVLERIELPPEQVIAVGDAENDLSFLSYCGFPVAVSNATPEIEAIAKHITAGPSGAGVAELIYSLLQGS